MALGNTGMPPIDEEDVSALLLLSVDAITAGRDRIVCADPSFSGAVARFVSVSKFPDAWLKLMCTPELKALIALVVATYERALANGVQPSPMSAGEGPGKGLIPDVFRDAWGDTPADGGK